MGNCFSPSYKNIHNHCDCDNQNNDAIKITIKYRNGKTNTMTYPESQQWIEKVKDAFIISAIH